MIDISHESLMRVWKRLLLWTEEERASTQMYRRASQASACFEQGTGSLWRDPELELGLQWRARSHPTLAWAHDTNFDRVMDFLDRSARERDRLLAQQERARKSKLHRAWSIAGLLGALSAACGIFAWFAVAERNRAELNLHTATEAVDQMLLSAGSESGRVATEIPEVQRFRNELLSKAEAFYVRFLKQKPGSQELQREMAVAHLRLGDIHRLNQQISGEGIRAIDEYDAAARAFGTLAEGHPDNAEYREQEANAYNWLGETQRLFGQSEAEHAFNKALRIQQQLHRSEPHNNDYTRELARSYYNRGIVRAHFANLTGADRDYLQAIELLGPLARLGGGYRQELDRVYNDRANLLADLGHSAEAELLYEQSIVSHQALLRDLPGNRDYELELDEFSTNLALLYRQTRRFNQAERWWGESYRHIQALARPAPSVVIRMAKSHLVHASILRAQGKPAGAAGECEKAIQLLAENDSGELGSATLAYHLTYGEALDYLAELHLMQDNIPAAAGLLTRAVRQNQISGDKRALAWDYAHLATAQLSEGLVSEANQSLEKMRGLLPQVTAHDKDRLIATEKIIGDRISSSNAAVTPEKREPR